MVADEDWRVRNVARIRFTLNKLGFVALEVRLDVKRELTCGYNAMPNAAKNTIHIEGVYESQNRKIEFNVKGSTHLPGPVPGRNGPCWAAESLANLPLFQAVGIPA